MADLTMGQARDIAKRAIAALQGKDKIFLVTPEELDSCFVNGQWHFDVIIETAKLGIFSKQLNTLKIVEAA